ncbi:MAG TPA: DUF2911 domain-containing protein [Vicinamibacteria bacterium]|nr:DUF2911 domain-containing protein [Vicinamibacteria bacterium]
MRQSALTLTSAVALTIGFAAGAAAQANPRGEASVTLAGKTIAVEYGRPSLKGRDMLGQAAVGQEWRMGADSATTLKTAATLGFGAAQVPPGDYVLRARKVSDTDWRLKVEKDEKAVAEIPLQPSTLDKSVEVFTIDLAEEGSQGVFRMSWGDRALAARFTAK